MSNEVNLAGCVIADEAGKVLLIHRNTDQFRHWELPGGKVEPNEMEEQAAIRELDEELGVAVKVIKKLGAERFTDTNGAFHYTWFQAEILAGEPRVCEPEKFDEYKFLALEELPQLTLSANMERLLPKLLSKEIVLTP